MTNPATTQKNPQEQNNSQSAGFQPLGQYFNTANTVVANSMQQNPGFFQQRQQAPVPQRTLQELRRGSINSNNQPSYSNQNQIPTMGQPPQPQFFNQQLIPNNPQEKLPQRNRNTLFARKAPPAETKKIQIVESNKGNKPEIDLKVDTSIPNKLNELEKDLWKLLGRN